MGKPMMIQEEDELKIDELKLRLGAKTKIDVVRQGLRLLEVEVQRIERIKRWKRAVKAVGNSGVDVLKEFQTAKRFEKLP